MPIEPHGDDSQEPGTYSLTQRPPSFGYRIGSMVLSVAPGGADFQAVATVSGAPAGNAVTIQWGDGTTATIAAPGNGTANKTFASTAPRTITATSTDGTSRTVTFTPIDQP